MSRSTSSATKWKLIAKSDTVSIADGKPVAIQCGTTAGTFVLVDENGNTMPVALGASAIGPYQPVRINSTGSDAVDVYGLYNN